MNKTLSRAFARKLKIIRLAERRSQAVFAKETGIGLSTIKNYETGITDVGLSVLEKVITHRDFRKYTLWLMLDDMAPEIGQIAPVVSEAILSSVSNLLDSSSTAPHDAASVTDDDK
ncbi:TPA: helix-turn-helix transcriptional regulator [Serratia marcescens]|nr:helix-turn-helix transcriptional regulator [Serratia marcescens]